MCCSQRLRVAVHPPSQLGAWTGPGLLPPAAAHAGDRPRDTGKGIDRRGDSADFPQPRGLAASLVRGSYGDVSGTKLSWLPLLF
jgi:hypothetical protein